MHHNRLLGSGHVPHSILDAMFPARTQGADGGNYGQEDFTISPFNVRLDASLAPSWVTWAVNAHGFGVLEFSVSTENYIHLDMQLPHSRVPGTDVSMHVHFTNHKGVIANGEVVTWQMRYTYADINGVYTTTPLATMTYTNTTGGNVALNSHLKTTESTLTLSDAVVSGIIVAFLVVDPATTTVSDNVGLLSVDVHIQNSRFGSEEV